MQKSTQKELMTSIRHKTAIVLEENIKEHIRYIFYTWKWVRVDFNVPTTKNKYIR
jgi:hypothetical protein